MLVRDYDDGYHCKDSEKQESLHTRVESFCEFEAPVLHVPLASVDVEEPVGMSPFFLDEIETPKLMRPYSGE